MAKPTVLLLSSDLRRRYAEDILTALAMPAGSMIQFRYEAAYVAPALQRAIADGTVVGSKAIVAFIADRDTDKPFLVPVRFAPVVWARCVADIFIIKLQVGAYVNLDHYPRAMDDIVTDSARFIAHLVAANGGFYPAVLSFPDLHVEEAADPATHWLGAARRLLLHSTFANSYVLRIDEPVTQRGRALEFNSTGRLTVIDQESVHLPVSFYAERYDPDAKPLLACSTDGTFVRVSSDDEYEIALRYDSVEFWLHPAALNFDTLSRVTITLRSQDGTSGFVPAHARFPVTVRRSTSNLVTRVTLTAAGAMLVALPAILGAGSPLQLRIAAAVTGAAILAVVTVVLGSAR